MNGLYVCRWVMASVWEGQKEWRGKASLWLSREHANCDSREREGDHTPIRSAYTKFNCSLPFQGPQETSTDVRKKVPVFVSHFNITADALMDQGCLGFPLGAPPTDHGHPNKKKKNKCHPCTHHQSSTVDPVFSLPFFFVVGSFCYQWIPC